MAHWLKMLLCALSLSCDDGTVARLGTLGDCEVWQVVDGEQRTLIGYCGKGDKTYESTLIIDPEEEHKR